MAAALRKGARPLFCRFLLFNRQLSTQIPKSKQRTLTALFGCASGAVITWYAYRKWVIKPAVYAKEVHHHEGDAKVAAVQTQREMRFLSFASVEYEGNVYMTPQDFLESVTEEAPRPRVGRSRLRKEEVDKFLKTTPSRWKGSTRLFRNLHDKGLISYTEYLFLLCVLTKPHSGFGIAFNMFDTDGNQRVDKKEFLVLINLFRITFGKDPIKRTEKQPMNEHRTLWEIVTQFSGLCHVLTGLPAEDTQTDQFVQDTTLTVHFFGRYGNEVLKYEDFHRFMDNLQTEVMELEYNEFSHGMATITEEEFATILLRYTILSKEEHRDYLKRLRERIPHVKGISFQDFKEFGQFLNNLDDFAIAMRMYTLADQPISEGEFMRAVKVCTGQSLNSHLVHTVFQLFDLDGDGHLSHKEFISVMKDRLHRGFKSHLPQQTTWDTFKGCVKNEMRKV